MPANSRWDLIRRLRVKGLKLLKTPGNGRLNNLNDPSRPQCVKTGSLLCTATLERADKQECV